MTATRHLILISDSPSDITKAMDRLDAAFIKAHKRKMAAGLFFSSWNETKPGGTTVRSTYGLTVYSEPGQEAEARWLAENASANVS